MLSQDEIDFVCQSLSYVTLHHAPAWVDLFFAIPSPDMDQFDLDYVSNGVDSWSN